jgi:GT2 family glycosyltransferase
MSNPAVSFLISTFNRRNALLETLSILNGPVAGASASEIIVVDNASTDGAGEAVARQFPSVRLIRAARNRGPCAKNLGLAEARGQYVVFLDDDSFPAEGSIDRMIEHFEADDRLGAASFNVTMSDGQGECSAYPDVFIGCGAGFRREVFRQVGGLPEDFFIGAEEYDLSLRLLDARWKVQTFDDLHVTHMKTPVSRFPALRTRLDVRNSLTLIGRYFPRQWVVPFAADWANRYRMMALANRRFGWYCAGLAAGLARMLTGRNRRPVSAATFEKFAKVQQTEELLSQAKRELGLRSVLMVDLGKNMLSYWRAARRCGLKVVAVADAKLGSFGFRYRGVPIVEDAAALRLPFDAALVSNLSPVHAEQRRTFWRGQTDRPVIDLFEADYTAYIRQAA